MYLVGILREIILQEIHELLDEVALSHKKVLLDRVQVLFELKLLCEDLNNPIVSENSSFFRPLLKQIEALPVDYFYLTRRQI